MALPAVGWALSHQYCVSWRESLKDMVTGQFSKQIFQWNFFLPSQMTPRRCHVDTKNSPAQLFTQYQPLPIFLSESFFFSKEHLCFWIYSENGLHKTIALLNRLYIMIIKGLDSGVLMSLAWTEFLSLISLWSWKNYLIPLCFNFSIFGEKKNNNYVNNQGSLVLSTTFAEAEERYNNLMMLSRVVRMGTLQILTLWSGPFFWFASFRRNHLLQTGIVLILGVMAFCCH